MLKDDMLLATNEAAQEEQIKNEVSTVKEEISSTNEIVQEQQEENEEEIKPSATGAIVIKQRKKVKIKDYANFYLKIKTLDRLTKNCKRTGINKSELVDILLNEAMDRLEVK